MKQYKILRHVNFFAATNVVPAGKMKEFFTKEAIDSFIKYGFIEVYKEKKTAYLREL